MSVSRLYRETFDDGPGGWFGWIDNAAGPRRLEVRESALVTRSPWWIDYNHAPPGAGYLHLLAILLTRGPFGEHQREVAGENRFVRIAWRKTGGKSIAIHFAREGAFPPPDTSEPRLALRYHIGRLGQLDYGNGLKIKDAPNENWEVVTRDLFADFGDVNLSGMRLTCADGESAWFDHLYFARRQEDFESVDPGRQKRTDPLQTASDEVKRDLLDWTYEPTRFTELISQTAPRWSSSKIGEGLRLWKQFKGRERVLQTHPVDPKTPCVLRSAVTLPEGKATRLKLAVTQFNPESDWLLKVKVAGEFVHEQLINAALTKNEWAEIEVDLSKFAGQTVPVELHHHPNNWSFETGYWARIAVE